MDAGMTLGPMERMLAEHACQRLVLWAAMLSDAQRHEEFAALFTDDGVLVRPGAEPLRGRSAIVESYRYKPTDRITRHLVSNILVELDTDTSARALSYVTLWSGSAGDPAGPFGRPAQPRQAVGEFVDTFAWTHEGWRISSREARFMLFREDAIDKDRPEVVGRI
jgi:hypothetical protein